MAQLNATVEIKPAWMNIISDAGDIDVVPIGEEHTLGTGKCACNPRVEMVGAYMVIVHESADHREFVERAIDIMNGGSGE